MFKMKRKFLIRVFLLFLILQPLVGVNSTIVQVTLTLEKNPFYYIGITSEKINLAEDISTKATTEVTLKEENYHMICDSSLYLSYYFQEFDRVKITAQLSGNLCWNNKNENWESTEQIPYSLTIYDANNSVIETIDSSNTSEFSIFNTESLSNGSTIKNGASQTLGSETYNSYKLNIASDYDLANNSVKLGSYKSSVTFKVVSY